MKDDSVYLDHIHDAIRDVDGYGSLGRDAFMAERMRHDQGNVTPECHPG